MEKQKKIFALGFFDGVHKGHQMVFDLCQHLAKDAGAATAAITFEKHPQSLFTPNPPALLNTTEDRRWLIQTWAGIDGLLVLPVNEQMMNLSWQDFLEKLLQEGAAGFVCGYDFRFGKNGEGNAEKLQNFCAARYLPCAIVPEQTLDGKRISSTYIRTLIEDGDMITAAQFLGHLHILSGEVVPGRHLGRTIDTPTANILLPEGVVVPKLGVYACLCDVDGRTYVAVTNIGSRPTVNGHQKRVEAWILDFDGCLYGKRIMLKFHKFLRPEQKFSSLKELKKQIQRDAGTAYMLLK